ncbi:uncharacterized mitochondrial protein AtMg00810-like [Nymphaea colorata]|uniref:uncharacterized mitochondrial protein AtMg00810-like n=1 Tax=Nymphaea colorata TaxID=210225 RepID=UPI00214DF889|nr:uncharacterized mitochondrial protein AtMg00810-like [Nymphaea colorata]
MANCKPINTPNVLNTKLNASDRSDAYSNPRFYGSIVGMLQYLTFTCPDIVYAVNQVSQFMHVPTEGHMDAIKHILRYLKVTVGDGLVYTRKSIDLDGHTISTYIDADWAGNNVQLPDRALRQNIGQWLSTQLKLHSCVIFFGNSPFSILNHLYFVITKVPSRLLSILSYTIALSI